MVESFEPFNQHHLLHRELEKSYSVKKIEANALCSVHPIE